MSKRKRKQSGPVDSKILQPPKDPSPLETTEASGPNAEATDQPVRLQHGLLPPLSRILSVVMLILGIVVVGALFLKVMAGFFVPLFLAALLVVIFRPVHQWFYQRTGNRPRLAAMLTTSLVLLMVLIPVVALISVATSQRLHGPF